MNVSLLVLVLSSEFTTAITSFNFRRFHDRPVWSISGWIGLLSVLVGDLNTDPHASIPSSLLAGSPLQL